MHDRYPAQNPRAAWRVYDGEAVIVSPDDSTMHALNAVGTTVWQAADGATTLAALIARVAEQFDAPAELVECDVTTFVVQLTSRGLLSLNEAPGPRGAGARWVEAAALRSAYEAPRLLSEGIFETTALACGKLPAQSGKCSTRPKAS
jgi:hypothetical protein